MRKIAVFIGSRANYSSIKSAMTALSRRKDVELQVITGSSAVIERYGEVANLIEQDGFSITMRLHNLIDGGAPVTMAKSAGLGLIDAAGAFQHLKPEVVVVVGDRFEVMPVAIAAAYMNIPLAHTMGGEVSGTIDESIRHAITKLAHLHFVASDDARGRIVKMGEDPERVYNTGCPRIDLVAQELKGDSSSVLRKIFERLGGVGPVLDIQKPFLLVSQHPVTTEYGTNRRQIEATLEALDRLKHPTVMLWPNPDAGTDDISAGIRSFRENRKPDWLHLFKNLPTSEYIHLMNTTACLVGNSSSGIREGAFIGTPVVNVGTRQQHRPHAENVVHAGHDAGLIEAAVRKQLAAGKRAKNPLYGDGQAGERIAEILATVEVDVQKYIRY